MVTVPPCRAAAFAALASALACAFAAFVSARASAAVTAFDSSTALSSSMCILLPKCGLYAHRNNITASLQWRLRLEASQVSATHRPPPSAAYWLHRRRSKHDACRLGDRGTSRL